MPEETTVNSFGEESIVLIGGEGAVAQTLAAALSSVHAALQEELEAPLDGCEGCRLGELRGCAHLLMHLLGREERLLPFEIAHHVVQLRRALARVRLVCKPP